jgi:molecular chaperone GrpE (heat shock protein)
VTFFTRLRNAWGALTGKPSEESLSMAPDVASVKRELAEIQLDLMDARKLLSVQRSTIDELRASLDSGIDHNLERLFREIATPLSQLRMQEALLESGTQVSGASVMALARQVAERVERSGLEPIGSFGETVDFDPQSCEPLSADSSLSWGEEVVIRFIGYRYGGRVVRKAMVERNN